VGIDINENEGATVTIVPAEVECKFEGEFKGESLERKITEVLSNLGMPRNVKGFDYVRQAIVIRAVNKRLKLMDVYSTIAVHNNDTQSCVERAIRHSIELAFKRGPQGEIDKLFKHSIDPLKNKPTNGEFISLLADEMRYEMKGGEL